MASTFRRRMLVVALATGLGASLLAAAAPRAVAASGAVAAPRAVAAPQAAAVPHAAAAPVKATEQTAASAPAAFALPSNVTQECPASTTALAVACMALVRNDVSSASPSGFGPSDLLSAYNLTSAASAGGTGETIAIVDVYDDPNAVSDFNAYRAQYGLPACDTTTEAGCLTKVNESGATTSYPAADAAWAAQESMDVDMAAAICPNCHVLLVEATAPTNWITSMNSAVALGAKFISLGFGSLEGSFSPAVPLGIAVTAAAGDSGYGTQIPASSPYVTAVGGTSLSAAPGTTRGWTETTWSGTGSGCSAVQGKPSWQSDTGCANRTANDVAAVADPETGVAFYDTYQFGGWGEGGGTNVSSAIVSGVYALAGTPTIYSWPTSYPYHGSAALNPVTSGSNGTCTPSYLCAAGTGYNGPVGLGTPNGTSAFAAPSGNIVAVAPASANASTRVGTSVGYVMRAWDSGTNPGMTVAVTGLPPGMISPMSCVTRTTGGELCNTALEGAPTKAGTFNVTVTATDTTGASGSITFPIHVTDVITIPSQGHGATIGTAVNIPLDVTSKSGDALNFSVTGLPPGLTYSQTGPDEVTFTGTPTTLGTYTSTVTATNPLGGSATGTITWTVHGTITLAPLPNRTNTVGDAVQLPINASDSVAGTQLWYTVTGVPGWNVEQGEGLYSGWLTTAGTYAVVVTVWDDYGAVASENFTWTVKNASNTGPAGPIHLNLGGKCLDGNGTKVQIWTCNGGSNQNWTMVQDWTVRIHGLCLTETGTNNGSRVVLASCNGGTAQQWQIQDNASGPWGGPALISLASGRCLDDRARSTVNGTVQEVWSCNGGSNQTWVGPAAPLQDELQGMCLADPANATANGTRVVLWQCNGWKEENWTLEADGTIRIHGKCLDDTNINGGQGTPVVLETCNGSLGEEWGFDPYTYVNTSGQVAGYLLNLGRGANPGVAGNSAVNGTPVVMSGYGISIYWRPM